MNWDKNFRILHASDSSIEMDRLFLNYFGPTNRSVHPIWPKYADVFCWKSHGWGVTLLCQRTELPGQTGMGENSESCRTTYISRRNSWTWTWVGTTFILTRFLTVKPTNMTTLLFLLLFLDLKDSLANCAVFCKMLLDNQEKNWMISW